MTSDSHSRRTARPSQALSPAQHSRLAALVERRAPELSSLATEAVNCRWLTDTEVEALSRVVLGEFLDHFGPGDEPDRTGVEADDLLGVIEMQRPGYWDH